MWVVGCGVWYGAVCVCAFADTQGPATALCSLLIAAKQVAKILLKWKKGDSTSSSQVDAKLDTISYRFWTGALLTIAVIVNFVVSLEFSWIFMVLSLPLVVVENVIRLFA